MSNRPTHTRPKPLSAFAPLIPFTFFVQTVYALAEALQPYIQAIGTDMSRPWQHRSRAVARLNRILQQLLAIPARLNPRKVGPAAFAPSRPFPQKSAQTPTQACAQPPARTPAARFTTRRRPLSARRNAMHLAALLRELQQIASDTGHPIPPELQHLCNQAQTQAGCHALKPVQHPSKTITPPPEPGDITPHPPAPPRRPPNPPPPGNWRIGR